MKLSEFALKNEKQSQKIDENTNENKDRDKKETIESMYDKYKNYSQDELTNALFKQIDEQKQNGTFDKKQIENSINLVMPFLNDEQKNNLMTILNKIQ